MSGYGKPDHTGRSSGKWTAKEKKIFGPPDEPWIWETSEMKCSPAWKAQGINTRRLIDFLEVEHRNHAGRENGNLAAPYDQLVAFGLSRSEIHSAIEEADFFGLIRNKRGGRWAGTNQPSRFRLTFYADKDGNPPTNEWKGKTAEAIEAWKEDRTAAIKAKKSRRKKQIPGSTSRTTVVRLPELPNRKIAKRK